MMNSFVFVLISFPLVSLILSIFALLSVRRSRIEIETLKQRLGILEAPGSTLPATPDQPLAASEPLSGGDNFSAIDWQSRSRSSDVDSEVARAPQREAGAATGKIPVSAETEPSLWSDSEQAAVPPESPTPESPTPELEISQQDAVVSDAQPDWERFFGVRGAAVLGGAVLALAGLFFVKYWIDAGVLTPPVRVSLGFLGALAALFSSRFLRRRAYEPSANALAGASVVLAYGASWAGHSLYGLIPGPVALLSFVGTTLLAGWLAWRHDTPVIAGLGLLGGFATPFVLESSGSLGLLFYLVALNAGALGLGRARGWRWLAIAAQLATLPHQFLWIYELAGSEAVTEAGQTAVTVGGFMAVPMFVGLATLQLFGSGWMTNQQDGDSSLSVAELSMRLLTLGSPLLLATLALVSVPTFPPLAMLVMMTLLSALAGFVGVSQERPLFPLLVGLGSAAVHGVWWLKLLFESNPVLLPDSGLTGSFPMAQIPALGSSLLVTLVLHVCFEAMVRRGLRSSPAVLSVSLPVVAFLLVTTFMYVVLPAFPFWPFLLLSVVWLSMLLRQSTVRGLCQGALAWPVVAMGLVAPSFLSGLEIATWSSHPGHPGASLLLLLLLGVLVGCFFFCRARLDRASVVSPWVGLLLVAAIVTLFLGATVELSLALFVLGFAILAVSSVLLSRVHRFAFVSPLFAFGASFVLFVHTVDGAGLAARDGWWFFPVLVLSAVLLTLAPHLRRSTGEPSVAETVLTPSRGQWLGAALMPLFSAAPLLAFWDRFDLEHPGLVLVSLALLAGLGFKLVRARRVSATVGTDLAEWTYGVVGAILITTAAVVEFEGSALTVALALLGFGAFLVWWRFLDSSDGGDPLGPRVYFTLILSSVALRLGWHGVDFLFDRPDEVLTPVLSWLTPTFLLPASIFSSIALALERRSSGSFSRTVRLFATFSILSVFAWLNLTVLGAFEVVSAFERLPMRDLLISLSWGLFAMALLALGTLRDRLELRWASLGFLLLTITKVFLYDLGELEDLWRVASLVGLAFSLLSVSLFYQRFVFRR